MSRNKEKGQAILLVATAMGIVLVGALGLAIDSSQLYAHRQMAQEAADAAAEGGIMSIFGKTNDIATNPAKFATTASFPCGTDDAATPCKFAAKGGFKTANTPTDTVQ